MAHDIPHSEHITPEMHKRAVSHALRLTMQRFSKEEKKKIDRKIVRKYIDKVIKKDNGIEIDRAVRYVKRKYDIKRGKESKKY